MTERSSNIAMISLMSAMAGAATALLLTPRTGKETRAFLRQRSVELKDQAHEGLKHAQETAAIARESFSEALEKTSRKAKEQYDEFAEDAKRTGAKQSPVLRTWEEEV